MIVKQIEVGDFIVCESLYQKVWDREVSVVDITRRYGDDGAHGSIVFDSRGYPRGFGVYVVTPKLTAFTMIAVQPGYLFKLLEPLDAVEPTPIQMSVPEDIYERPDLIQDLSDLGFKATGLIHADADSLVKFYRP